MRAIQKNGLTIKKLSPSSIVNIKNIRAIDSPDSAVDVVIVDHLFFTYRFLHDESFFF